MKVSAVILAYNEEKHLSRCIASLAGLADEILVIDSLSTDRTVEIAIESGARVLQRPWRNYSDQFNWALSQLTLDTHWVLRIDADEVLSRELLGNLRGTLPTLPEEVTGVVWGRRIAFQGRPITFGGLFPLPVLRMFRNGKGRCENRWMDEHIKTDGVVVKVEGEMLDDNLNSLTWWTEKHNKYASREAVDLLNLEFGFLPVDSIAGERSEAGFKRWIKERVYSRLPLGTRAYAYFLYRYFIRLGFLDHSPFHFLQGLWYRYLVDAKVAEVKQYMKLNGVGVAEAINNVLNIRV